MADKPTIGPVSLKTYQCTKCEFKSRVQTNHWGDIYSACPDCGTKHHHCVDTVPSEFGLPEAWSTVQLRDGENIDSAIDRLVKEGRLLPEFAKYYRLYLKGDMNAGHLFMSGNLRTTEDDNDSTNDG